MQVIALFLVAALGYLVLRVIEHIRATPSAADLLAPIEHKWALGPLAGGLACEASFPGIDAATGGHFARWREFHRRTLRGAEASVASRDRVQALVQVRMARHSAAETDEERAWMKWRCGDALQHHYTFPSEPVYRASEVLANYQICAATVVDFDRRHASDLKAWKRRNESAVDGLTCWWSASPGTCSRGSWQRQLYLNTLRESELLRLRNGDVHTALEQVTFCRETVVRWLRSGI